VLAEPNLRALNLHEDPQLEVLDLRGAGEQDYLHYGSVPTPLLHQARFLDALWQCRRTLSAWHHQGGRKRKRRCL
jgi:hypothetical protein